MPSYFCSKCQALITLAKHHDPNDVVCEQCKKRNTAVKKKDVNQGETADEEKTVICTLAESFSLDV
jgi:DNA-directed RNA polymerase subunit M/transcription elongation factor TFIIS